LVIRGYRAINTYKLIARWDLEALIATVDGALETAGWSDFDREAARAAIRELYSPDLA
jgi:hypothetical protein